jgi:hypothetical protein
MRRSDSHISTRDAEYHLFFRIMVGAALAVIIVSLVGVGFVTGVIPRLGQDAQRSTQATEQRAKNDHRQNKDRPDTQALRSSPVTEHGAR